MKPTIHMAGKLQNLMGKGWRAHLYPSSLVVSFNLFVLSLAFSFSVGQQCLAF